MFILEAGVSLLRSLEQKRIERARSSELPHVRIRQHLRDGGSVEFRMGESDAVSIVGTDIRGEEWGTVFDSVHNNPNETLHIRLVDADGNEQKYFSEGFQQNDLLREIWQTLAWS